MKSARIVQEATSLLLCGDEIYREEKKEIKGYEVMDDKVLRKLQLTMLETLKMFDAFCRKHDIKYSLYAGTLLGAVRHKGFIPWDDDIDVCMSRAEYNRFVSLWEKEQPTGYILQNKENTPSFSQSFSKIRIEHTTFLQEEWEAGKYHTGIFLDIFPLDRIPSGRWNRILFKWYCMKYQLLTREFVPTKAGAIMYMGSAIILAFTPRCCRERVRQKTLKKITRFNNQHDLEIVAIETVESQRITYALDMLDKYVELPFEDSKFMCVASWHDHLLRRFGEYMKLPPEEERAWRHHPIIIDFEHNYEEIEGNRL